MDDQSKAPRQKKNYESQDNDSDMDEDDDQDYDDEEDDSGDGESDEDEEGEEDLEEDDDEEDDLGVDDANLDPEAASQLRKERRAAKRRATIVANRALRIKMGKSGAQAASRRSIKKGKDACQRKLWNNAVSISYQFLLTYFILVGG